MKGATPPGEKCQHVSWQKADGTSVPSSQSRTASHPQEEKTGRHDNSKAVYFGMNAYLMLLTPTVQDSAL